MNFLLSPIAFKIVTVMAALDVMVVFLTICILVGRAVWEKWEEIQEARRVLRLIKDPIWFDLERDVYDEI